MCFFVTSEGSEGNSGPPAIFTGDTIFPGGVGAFFEGTSAHMVAAMGQLIQLPDDTLVRFPLR